MIGPEELERERAAADMLLRLYAPSCPAATRELLADKIARDVLEDPLCDCLKAFAQNAAAEEQKLMEDLLADMKTHGEADRFPVMRAVAAELAGNLPNLKSPELKLPDMTPPAFRKVDLWAPAKALTLHQPYATAIAAGFKRYETRSWRTSYRGRLVIHAGLNKSTPAEFAEFGIPHLSGDAQAALAGNLPLGAAVAVCRLVECWPTPAVREVLLRGEALDELSLGNFRDGRWAWELADVQPLLVPVSVAPGFHRGLWAWPPPARL